MKIDFKKAQNRSVVNFKRGDFALFFLVKNDIIYLNEKIMKKISNSELWLQSKNLFKETFKLLYLALFLWSSYLLYMVSGKFLLLIMFFIIIAAIISSILVISLTIFAKYLWKKIKKIVKKNKEEKKDEIKQGYFLTLKNKFFKVFIKNLSIIIIILVLPIISVKFYNNFYTQKGYYPRIIAENSAGKKIAFQGMRHSSSSSFYKNIFSDVQMFLFDKDFVLWNEIPEDGFYNDFKDVPEKIKSFFRVFFVISSDNKDFILKICNNYSTSTERPYEKQFFLQNSLQTRIDRMLKEYPEKNIKSDISKIELAEIITKTLRENPEYVNLLKEKEKRLKEFNDTVNDIKKFFLERGVEKINNNQREIINEFCYNEMNNPVYFSYSAKSKELFNKIFLDVRNKKLAKKVQNSKTQKIYLLYGAAHIKGFFEELKKLDNSWKIDAVSWIPVGKEKEEFKYDLDPILNMEWNEEYLEKQKGKIK